VNTPKHATDEQIEKLFADELKPAIAISEVFKRLEAMMTTRGRHRPDVYECRDCGHKFTHEISCPECRSSNIAVFMRAPSRSEIRHHSADRESELTDLDPDWRERFHGDVDRAWDYYKPRRVGIPYAGNGNSEPYEYKDDHVTFDDDLEPTDAA
jgi:predicted Zn-ribbon and HTH transcriptional regulator